MKVLLLNYSDTGGGAAIAAGRLLDILRRNNVDAVLGVIEKHLNGESTVCLKKTGVLDKYKVWVLIKKVMGKLARYVMNIRFHTSNPVLHSVNKKTLLDSGRLKELDYDLIHLHWINNNMISIEDIKKIDKPIVWTLHDSWAFCGAEHHPNILEKDTRFVDGYTKTNRPVTTRGKDICAETWKRKKKHWKNIPFNFIAPSAFMHDSFHKSALFRGSPCTCTVIPNTVPGAIFRPLDKDGLKKMYGIPSGKHIIGFGTAENIDNKKSLKGGYMLLEMLKKIRNKEDFHLVVFGNCSAAFTGGVPVPAFETGFISNPYILAGIYNLCDVFVCPSFIETLPTVCLEAMSCGIPVTAFRTTGILDTVEHKVTGYLAECFDTDDLLNGVLFCIENNRELSQKSLLKAKKDFDSAAAAEKHIALYKSVLNGGKPNRPAGDL